MSWFKNLLPSKVRAEGRKKGVPEGLWSKCESCGAVLYRAELERNLGVCLKCTHHHRISARRRLTVFLDDDGAIQELATDIEAVDWLKFRDSKKYKDRLNAAQKQTQEKEALLVMQGNCHQIPVVACAFEFGFMGGSMGAAVGSRFVRAVDAAIAENRPLIAFSASGGARMQEGLISLFQMGKTSAALARLSSFGLPYISVLTDPTMGGVAASLAMLGDIIIAEPAARVGFAGPRVIEQTMREPLPEGFQRSEFLLEKGAIDMIVNRTHMRSVVAGLLSKLLHLDALHDAT